jgi:hypothetical protein
VSLNHVGSASLRRLLLILTIYDFLKLFGPRSSSHTGMLLAVIPFEKLLKY